MSMSFKFEITNMNGSAFDDFPEEEVARLLRKVADMLEDGSLLEGGVRPLHDVNGATVGTWGATTEEDEENDL